MKKSKVKEFLGVGRRKRAVATVRLRKGKGSIIINERTLENYFPTELQRKILLEPIDKLSKVSNYDMIIRLSGGGIEAQAEAIRLGISRALVLEDENNKAKLKDLGFLTRDPRKKERKKYGLAGARKRFQFSKR